jgi:hypothetical protein
MRAIPYPRALAMCLSSTRDRIIGGGGAENLGEHGSLLRDSGVKKDPAGAGSLLAG